MNFRPVFAAMAIAAFSLTHANLLTNGDFEAGNFGFSSQYLYETWNTAEGQYTVTSQPELFNPGFAPVSGTGNVLAVNGSPSAGEYFWSETISVVPFTEYSFQAQVGTADYGYYGGYNVGQLQLQIQGVNVGGTFDAPTSTGVWLLDSLKWNSGPNSQATLAWFDTDTEILSNDFYVDNLSFQAVPEPGTLAVLALGLVSGLRRRSKSVL